MSECPVQGVACEQKWLRIRFEKVVNHQEFQLIQFVHDVCTAFGLSYRQSLVVVLLIRPGATLDSVACELHISKETARKHINAALVRFSNTIRSMKAVCEANTSPILQITTQAYDLGAVDIPSVFWVTEAEVHSQIQLMAFLLRLQSAMYIATQNFSLYGSD